MGRRPVVVEILGEAKTGVAVNWRVLHVDAGLAVGRDDELEALVEPAVATIAVEHQTTRVVGRGRRLRGKIRRKNDDEKDEGNRTCSSRQMRRRAELRRSRWSLLRGSASRSCV